MTVYGPGDPRGVYVAMNSEPPAEFTIGGKTMEQLDREAAERAAAQQRQAAAALSGDQTPCDAAQSAYNAMCRVPQQQQVFNAQAEARANEQAKEFGIDPTDPEFGAKLSQGHRSREGEVRQHNRWPNPRHRTAIHGRAAGRGRP